MVVTDTVMPRMSGPELVERLEGRQPGHQVIFMSGHAPETVLKHGGAETGVAFLQEPFDVEDLLARMQEMLAAPERRHPRRRGPRAVS